MATASAQADVPKQKMKIRWDEGVPHITFSARHLVDAEVRRKLKSGLPQTLVMKVLAYPEGGGKPIAAEAHICRITYDLWEEVYRVEPASEQRAIGARSLSKVIDRCLRARDAAVGRSKEYEKHSGESIYFGVLAELNPVSRKTVEKIRRWIARPAGGGFQGEAFFGSFVSLFVNRDIGDAERRIRFRSQTTQVP